MFFHQRFIPGLAIASYMVGDEKAKQVAVIDPTRDVDEYVQIAKDEGLHITHILETHVHADYVSGSAELKSRLDGKPQVVVSGMGGKQWTPPYADQVVNDGDELTLGNIRLKAVHTPGHTPEHVTWALYDNTRSKDVPWLLFTGDFMFVGDVGRPDLLGPDEQKALAHQLYTSVFEKLNGVPDFTEIFPAHGSGSLCGKAIGSRRSSTLGFERKFNPALQPAAEAEWTDTLLQKHAPSSALFQTDEEGEFRQDRLSLERTCQAKSGSRPKSFMIGSVPIAWSSMSVPKRLMRRLTFRARSTSRSARTCLLGPVGCCLMTSDC